MFDDFKRAMAKEFEMTDIGLMSYYLGIEVKQRDDGIFISQEGYAKKFSRNLRWRIFEILDLYKTGYSFGVGLVSRHMEAPTTSHLKVAKRILRYIQGTIDHGIFYKSSQDFELVGYCDSDWAGDIDSRKSTTGFVYFMGSSAFTWNSKKQPIVTLSTCEAEYVAVASCVCHAIWLRGLLKELNFQQKNPTEIFVDNKSAIALAKNPVFHERSKHIDTKYHFIRDCISKKEVKLEYVKSQDQIADIFTKALKFDSFKKLRFSLGVMNLV
ncbi:UNVERIFIED_CONTAM: Copia protein [Sesamum latifolium]|uniref:Copia protein n=1 Tax=Sesamum latifolium TaxID=2727402 RepID=A0AAW2U4K6_9LAMI